MPATSPRRSTDRSEPGFFAMWETTSRILSSSVFSPVSGRLLACVNAHKSKGVKVIREPKTEDYGTVAVFHDLHENQWDRMQPSAGKTVE